MIEGIHAKESERLQDELWLYIDLPRFEWPIVWCEEEISSDPSSSLAPHHLFQGGRGAGRPLSGPSGTSTNASTAAALANAANTPQPIPAATSSATAQGTLVRPAERIERSLFTLPDPESQRENPIEAKHRRLVRAQRSRRRGLGGSTGGLGGAGIGNLALARNLKPDKKARDEIESILSSPPTRELTDKESDLLWTYRFYLTKNPRGLTKFLKAVSWNDRVESRMAVDTVLPLWAGGGATTAVDGTTITTTPVEIGDVLELLGPACKMMDTAVRKWAVERLAERDDAEISLYLLQLVQALKLDERDDDEELGSTSSGASRRPQTGASQKSGTSAAVIESSSIGKGSPSLGPLTELLVARALASARTATTPPATFSLLITFYWYLSVECADDRWGILYRRIRRRLEKGLDQAGEVGQQYLSIIRRQEQMVNKLGEMARGLRQSKDGRLKKIEKLKEGVKNEKGMGLLDNTEGEQHGSAALAPAGGLPLPLDPTVLARHIKAEQCTVFKSNLFPLLIWFETEPIAAAHATNDTDDTPISVPAVEEYALIFKSGDDLRQDQLVLQLFQLMDRLLLNENLDLKLTPYRVLATAPKEGMVQFVKSKTLANIVNEHGTLNEYLRVGGGAGTEEEKMDRFVRSCAGYCVVTYLLGVGDRHLDNLLLAPDGRFFHGESSRISVHPHLVAINPDLPLIFLSFTLLPLPVDFGYILNRDPKPFPPPVKVSKEMVDCMGGPTSPNHARFRQLCFTAFSILRKNANLILNLVGLMQDAPVGDIKVEPDRAVGKVLEKFRLDLSDSDARVFFDDLLQQSSYLTVVFDRLHDAAQFFRS